MPVVSDDYKRHIKWDGTGEIPEKELQRMREIIQEVHAENKLFRWWGAPDNVKFKRFFSAEGVDLIGTDELNQLSEN